MRIEVLGQVYFIDECNKGHIDNEEKKRITEYILFIGYALDKYRSIL